MQIESDTKNIRKNTVVCIIQQDNIQTPDVQKKKKIVDLEQIKNKYKNGVTPEILAEFIENI